jgi:hypothetical protein
MISNLAFGTPMVNAEEVGPSLFNFFQKVSAAMPFSTGN